MTRDYHAPLVLYNDELYFDAGYPPQDFKMWQEAFTSQKVAKKRTKIYVVPPPEYTARGLNLQWLLWPKTPNHWPPKSGNVVDYLAAFYHGLEVVQLPSDTFTFDVWKEGRSKTPKEGRSKTPKQSFVAINTSTESIRVRKRAPPKERYPYVQLNLNDLLDVAISILPQDALTLLMLVDHDLYEDDDDDFACGRAYGGSHVCIVSTFRYGQRQRQSEGETHVWPASHCAKYVEEEVSKYATPPKAKKRRTAGKAVKGLQLSQSVPLQKAIKAHCRVSAIEDDGNARWEAFQSRWLSRVARCASHELGHCLGIDHCMYYACIMQGSASVQEDDRQPPYLCPVDEAKVVAMIKERGDAVKGRSRAREEALLSFCRRHADGGGFAAYEAWLQSRLAR